MFSPVLARRLAQSDLRVVLTGGGSWLGQASLLVLENAFGAEIADRVLVFGSHARTLRTLSGRRIEGRALADITSIPRGHYLFLHYSFITKGHVDEQSLAEYVRLNVEIADHVERAARSVGPKGFFLPSSGAVYQKNGSLHAKIDDSPYGVMKLQDERRFRNMCEEIGCALMPVRVFNVAGPCVNNVPGFVLSSIIADVLADRPVTLRATAPVYRSYVHVVDLVELALSGLLADRWGIPKPFDSAGEEVVEVGDLARLVTALMGVPDYPIQRPVMHCEPVDRYVGDRMTFLHHAEALGIALKPLRTAVLDMVSDLKMRQLANGL